VDTKISMTQPKVKDDIKDAVMTEENVVSKVKELMETLDHIKKYNALTRSLKKFAFIVISSIVVFLGLGLSFTLVGIEKTLTKPLNFAVGFILLLIPIIGLLTGVLYVRRRVNSAKTGEWKEELSHGFPSALKILMELDWDKTFDEIVTGKISYALYGLLKTGAYWFVIFFGLDIILNASTFYFLKVPIGGGFGLGLFSLAIVLLFLGKDLLRRYKELQALDMLLWELRWFSFELQRDEFQT